MLSLIKNIQVKSGEQETLAALWSCQIICNTLQPNIRGYSDKVLPKLFLSPNQLEISQYKISSVWVRAVFQSSQAVHEDWTLAWFLIPVLIPHAANAVQEEALNTC